MKFDEKKMKYTVNLITDMCTNIINIFNGIEKLKNIDSSMRNDKYEEELKKTVPIKVVDNE